MATLAFGFPVHFDWAWLTLFNPQWENAVFSYAATQKGIVNGSDAFRRVRFQMWIGYDF